MARKKIQVHYCDFCNQPIHQERHIIVIVTEQELQQTQYGRKVERKEQEICSSCKNIIDELFKMRKTKLKKIVAMIEDTFKLPSKKSKRGRDV